jgi:hypothetical protein
MGWNQGYTIFEATVIGAYDLGKLDKDLLTVLMKPYRNSDIDSGGSTNLKAGDGKDVEQIVIEIWGLEMPQPPAGEYEDNPEWEAHYEAIWDQFNIVTGHFGWR